MKTVTADIGTTTIKCALYKDGKRLKYYAKEYDLIYRDKRIYQDPSRWVEIIAEGIKSFCIKEKIDGISISSQGITIMPINEKGEPLSLADSWLDVSATEETSEIERRFGKEYIFKKTGKYLLPDYSMPKLMRFVKETAGAYKYLLPSDYIYFLLCGKYFTDYTMASGTMLFDIEKRVYDEELLEFTGIRKKQLAEPIEFGSYIGNVSGEASKKFGLQEGTPVIMGAQDQKCSAIYCGVDEKTVCVSVGTSTAVSTCEETEGYSFFAFDKNSVIYERAISTTGAAIKWLKNIAFGSYEEMDEFAVLAGDSGQVVFDTDFGNTASITGLTLGTGKGNLAYAVFEGVAKKITSVIPKGTKRITLYGGGTKSSVLVNEIKRYSGAEVCVSEDVETALAGANRCIEIYYERKKRNAESRRSN